MKTMLVAKYGKDLKASFNVFTWWKLACKLVHLAMDDVIWGR